MTSHPPSTSPRLPTRRNTVFIDRYIVGDIGYYVVMREKMVVLAWFRERQTSLGPDSNGPAKMHPETVYGCTLHYDGHCSVPQETT
jgi:hypothetical protein